MIPWFEWTTYSIGPLTLQVWGTFVALGIVLSTLIIKKRSALFELNAELMLDAVIWLLIGGFAGARFTHVFLYEPAFYLTNPVEIVKVWHGGLSSFGGFVGAVATFLWFVKKRGINRRHLYKISDILLFAGVYGWIVARIGCFLIHDHPGTLSHFFLALNNPNGPRLDMALLEIIGLIPVAFWLYITRNLKMPHGKITAVIFVYYGLLRLVLDFFRATDTRYIGLTPGQYGAIVMAVFGIYLWKKKDT